MKVRFWGVRGSLPSPGPETARYGGNTTCIQIIRDEGPAIIIDAGTGIRPLGDMLAASGRPLDIKLLITHTHWDHIHGFPFFAPIYIKGSKVEVFGVGPLREAAGFERVMADQMSYSYFPVETTMLGDVVSYVDWNKKFTGGIEKSYQLCEGVTVKLKLTNHPVYCVAYRVEADGKAFVFSGDHEPWFKPESAKAGDTVQLFSVMNERFEEFCAGADLLAMDTSYTIDEYDHPTSPKHGWGHSFFEFNIELAGKAGVKRLALTHHEPSRTDDDLDRLMEETYLPLADDLAPKCEVFAAREGVEIEL